MIFPGSGTQYEGQYHTVTGWGLTSAGGGESLKYGSQINLPQMLM